MDPLAVSAEVTPYVTAAVAAYGTAVLTRAQDATADATVALGQRLLWRMLGRREDSTPLTAAVEDLAVNPGDSDAEAALRMQIRKVITDDAALFRELAAMVRASGIAITASGERSIAAHTIHGGASTGDTTPRP
ncbi:hypothetical protein AB0D14_29700 [Streptomyces sp. NPDC048484]|uniref:hypothetical protein n=1 Tax=Streptomyces sp. NPDC048484 TaxID=3155146 RepID=UPI00343807A6